MGPKIGEIISHLSEGLGPVAAAIVGKIHVANRYEDNSGQRRTVTSKAEQRRFPATMQESDCSKMMILEISMQVAQA
jgi:hypothetical protein